ncbi:MAG: hypothetical protein ACFFD4_28200 [Candidatus Odinarchaeota archaeon]
MATETKKSRIWNWLFEFEYLETSWKWLFMIGHIAIVLFYLGLMLTLDNWLMGQVVPILTGAPFDLFSIAFPESLMVWGLLLMLLVVELGIMLYLLHLFTVLSNKMLTRMTANE